MNSAGQAGAWIDVTVPLRNELPIWPGSVGINLSKTSSFDGGDLVNVTRLDCDVHVGTHIETARHFIADGLPVDQLPVETLVGLVWVAEVDSPKPLTADALEHLDIPSSASRLLFKTPNSRLWANPAFVTDYVGLTLDGAGWIVERQIDLVGIDYLSIQKYEPSFETHMVLLRAGVAILEGLDMSDASEGWFDMVCLPLRLRDAEAAPARVLIRPRPEIAKGRFVTCAK